MARGCLFFYPEELIKHRFANVILPPNKNTPVPYGEKINMWFRQRFQNQVPLWDTRRPNS